MHEVTKVMIVPLAAKLNPCLRRTACIGSHPFQRAQLGSLFKSQQAGFLKTKQTFTSGSSTGVPPELLAHAWGWWIVEQRLPCLRWINVVSVPKAMCWEPLRERDAWGDDEGKGGKKKTEKEAADWGRDSEGAAGWRRGREIFSL